MIRSFMTATQEKQVLLTANLIFMQAMSSWDKVSLFQIGCLKEWGKNNKLQVKAKGKLESIYTAMIRLKEQCQGKIMRMSTDKY